MSKSPLPPGSSHPPGKLALDATLSTIESRQYQDRGRRTLSSEMPIITAREIAEFEAKLVADVVDLHKSTPDPVEESRRSLASPEVAQDLQQGVGVFREAVDTITSSLLLVIGKSEEGLDRSTHLANKIAKNNRVSRLNSLLSLLLIVGVALTLYRVNHVVSQNQANIIERQAVTAELVNLALELRGIRKEQAKTGSALEAVETRAAEKPQLEIVPDADGGAKVVIRQGTGSAASDEPSAAKPPSTGHPPPTSLEIPLRLPPGPKSPRILPPLPK